MKEFGVVCFSESHYVKYPDTVLRGRLRSSSVTRATGVNEHTRWQMW